MRILVLSFYYAPDLCAGSFRTTAFVEELKKQKFKPATLNNKPISEWISVKAKFSLI